MRRQHLIILAIPLWARLAAGVPLLASPFSDAPAPADLPQVLDRLYAAIEGQARHLLTTVHSWDNDPRFKLLTESKHDEHWIRPNTGAFAGFCFLYRFGAYDAARVGATREELLQSVVIPMCRYLVATHLTGSRATGDGEPWGDQWQSAHWAHMLARGAWWVWDGLPEDLREGVCRVIAHEADRFVRETPPHNLIDDTKAEENAWNCQALSTAIVLMPDDPRRPDWERAFQRWALSSFLRPADAASDAIVDGRRLSEQFTGANIYDDFTLENHRRVHPDYMSTFLLSMGCVIDFAMTGRTPPQAVFHNVAGLYENLKWFSLPAGGFVYPNGQDWELFRDPEWLVIHMLMAAHGGDADAWSLLRPCLDTQEKMQARTPSGAVYLDNEFFFPSTRTDQFYYNVLAWLFGQYRNPITDAPRTRLGVLALEKGRILLHRTPVAIHTVSWGAETMIQFVPQRLDRVTSPHAHSGIGHIRLAGEKEDLPAQVRRVDVNTEDGFSVNLDLVYGDGLAAAQWRVRSTPDGVMRWQATLTALQDIETDEVAAGLIGVLNNATWVYERGVRHIDIDGADHAVACGSGEVIRRDGVHIVSIDEVVRITSEKPLALCYKAAVKPDRARFTDELYLVYHDARTKWQRGAVIAELDVQLTAALE